jgi:hypothetical protein
MSAGDMVPDGFFLSDGILVRFVPCMLLVFLFCLICCFEIICFCESIGGHGTKTKFRLREDEGKPERATPLRIQMAWFNKKFDCGLSIYQASLNVHCFNKGIGRSSKQNEASLIPQSQSER